MRLGGGINKHHSNIVTLKELKEMKLKNGRRKAYLEKKDNLKVTGIALSLRVSFARPLG